MQDTNLVKQAVAFQKEELTEHHTYKKLSLKKGANKKILETISKDELGHHNFWKRISKQEVKPNWFMVHWYSFLANVIGLTFALRLMESGEEDAQKKYSQVKGVPGVAKIIKDEKTHERNLISLLKDERLDYAGSIVLGLNDALVELTGALAGMTLAIQNSTIVAIAGLVTGLAAALSMGASNYLATKEDRDSQKKPLKSALYTGVTYLCVVLILISPYFIFSNIFVSLAATLSLAVVVIAAYTFYISVARMKPFWNQFAVMASISLVTAGISFAFGLLLNNIFGI